MWRWSQHSCRHSSHNNKISLLLLLLVRIPQTSHWGTAKQNRTKISNHLSAGTNVLLCCEEATSQPCHGVSHTILTVFQLTRARKRGDLLRTLRRLTFRIYTQPRLAGLLRGLTFHRRWTMPGPTDAAASSCLSIDGYLHRQPHRKTPALTW